MYIPFLVGCLISRPSREYQRLLVVVSFLTSRKFLPTLCCTVFCFTVVRNVNNTIVLVYTFKRILACDRSFCGISIDGYQTTASGKCLLANRSDCTGNRDASQTSLILKGSFSNGCYRVVLAIVRISCCARYLIWAFHATDIVKYYGITFADCEANTAYGECCTYFTAALATAALFTAAALATATAGITAEYQYIGRIGGY